MHDYVYSTVPLDYWIKSRVIALIPYWDDFSSIPLEKLCFVEESWKNMQKIKFWKYWKHPALYWTLGNMFSSHEFTGFGNRKVMEFHCARGERTLVILHGAFSTITTLCRWHSITVIYKIIVVLRLFHNYHMFALNDSYTYKIMLANIMPPQSTLPAFLVSGKWWKTKEPVYGSILVCV